MIAVAAGVLWTYITGGGFNMVLVGLKVFPIVIIGGLDSIAGVLVGAMLIGWVETLAAGYLDPIVGGGFSHVTSYLLLIAMLLIRPWACSGVKPSSGRNGEGSATPGEAMRRRRRDDTAQETMRAGRPEARISRPRRRR